MCVCTHIKKAPVPVLFPFSTLAAAPLPHRAAKQHRGILQNTDMFSVFFSFYLLTNDMEALIMNIVHIEVIT